MYTSVADDLSSKSLAFSVVAVDDVGEVLSVFTSVVDGALVVAVVVAVTDEVSVIDSLVIVGVSVLVSNCSGSVSQFARIKNAIKTINCNLIVV